MGAVTGNGTTLSIDGGTTTVANLISVTPYNVSVALIDSTDMDSTWRSSIGGLKDGGDCSFEIAYDPAGATHQAITAAIDGSSKSIVVTYSNADTCSFSAIITSFAPSASIDDSIKASVGLKITGAVTFAS